MFGNLDELSRSRWRRPSSLYRPTVLVGNWFEERCSSETDPKAIIPGIYGKSGGLDDVTVYKTDFINPLKEDSEKIANDYLKLKQEGFSNRLSGEIANFTFGAGDSCTRNLPSITRTAYRMPPRKNHDEEYVPRQGKRQNVDNLQSYDVKNSNVRLMQRQACQHWMQYNYPYDVTRYREQFTPKSVIISVCCCHFIQNGICIRPHKHFERRFI
ncbi:uncharacterized protein ACN427_001611 isoform 1-T1 [Glossina fuscipes fuscipes]